jgi:surface carbohydrate biosynthesis protein (TIGR04326 family)
MRLWVLWQPTTEDIPVGDTVISFLFPRDEEEFCIKRRDIPLVFGREEISAIKPAALRIYTEVTARVGTAIFQGGQTLRQQLTRPGETSDWWYHGFSFRDPESSDAFTNITHVLATRAVAERLGAKSLVLRGAPRGVSEVLASIYEVHHRDSTPPRNILRIALQGLMSRLYLLFDFVRSHCGLRRHYELPTQAEFDVGFVSFWDIYLSYDSIQGSLKDPYFKNLPRLLAAPGEIRTGYFVWLYPQRETAKWRSLHTVLEPLRKAGNVIILQSFLRFTEVFREVFDFRPVWITLWSFRQAEFRAGLWEEGLNWLPILREDFLKGTFEAKIPRCRLVALATERAARRYRPRATVSFLEHFPHARAHYEGMRRAAPHTINYAVQHAGVCPDKTFYFLHPHYEMRGNPDGCAVPQPSVVFAMGELGQTCFLSYGYSADRVKMIGSPRYDHIRIGMEAKRNSEGGQIRVLLACSLDVKTEIALVEAAAVAATGLSQVSLRLRNHPLSRVDEHARFGAVRGSVEISRRTLSEDLDWADLVLFSYSTVADEAFLQGIPCWQWLPAGFDGSALVKAAPIPRFGSVAALRKAICNFKRSETIVSTAERARVASLLFAPTDGGAAKRIADEIRSVLITGVNAGTLPEPRTAG